MSRRALTPTEIAELAQRAGFRGDDLATAVAVAQGESGGRPWVNAFGPEDSRGLWQINVAAHADKFDVDRLYEPQYNAYAARAVWAEAKGFGWDPWRPWSVYTSGAYHEHLPEARRAVHRLQLGERDRRDRFEIEPWRMPRNGRVVKASPARLLRLAERLTDGLAVVDLVSRRSRNDAESVRPLRVADPALQAQLARALERAVDDWEGVRRLPYLMMRDIGYVLEVRRRVIAADLEEAAHGYAGAMRGKLDARDRRRLDKTVEALVGSLAGRRSRTTRQHTAALLRQLFGPDRRHGESHGRGGDGAGHDPVTLHDLALTARDRFHLSIREYPPFDRVDPVHVPGSFHDRGRAFDATGSVADMAAFANWVADKHGSRLEELFWNGPRPRNVDNGRPVPQWTVGGHTGHVHVAM